MRLSRRLPRIVAVLAAALALALALAPSPAGTPPELMRAGAVVVLAVGLWATAVLPEYFTAIVFFFFAIILGAAAPDVVLSGFRSGGVWIVFGGLVIALAVKETGLGDRIARLLTSRFRGSYLTVLYGVVIVTTLFDFVVPSA